MSKVTAFYVITLLFLAAVLWVVLQVGSTLHAPDDVSGLWTLRSEDGKETHQLTLTQSGKYIAASVDGKGTSLTMDPSHSRLQDRHNLLVGTTLQLDFGPASGTIYPLDSTGLLSGHFLAQRG